MKIEGQEGRIVVTDGTRFEVLGELSGKSHGVYEDAGEAIQAALLGLPSSGGTVSIGPGVYPLSEVLRVGDRQRLSGRGGVLKVSGTTGIELIGCKGARLEDLVIEAEGAHAEAGIVIDRTGECRVSGCRVTGFARHGLWLRNDAFLTTVADSTFAGNKEANIYCDHLAESDYGNYISNTLSRLNIYGGGKGIETRRAIVLNILDCSLYQTNGPAIELHSTSNSVLVSGCRTFQIVGNAVEVRDSHEINISSNIFCWHTGDGIVMENVCWGTVSANNVIDNGSMNQGGPNFTTLFADVLEKHQGVLPEACGLRLHSVRGVTVDGNAFFNWELLPKMRHGIFEDEDCVQNIISGNNINFVSGQGVVSSGAGSVVSDNVSQEKNHHSVHLRTPNIGKYIQTFQTELTEKFLDELRA